MCPLTAIKGHWGSWEGQLTSSHPIRVLVLSNPLQVSVTTYYTASIWSKKNDIKVKWAIFIFSMNSYTPPVECMLWFIRVEWHGILGMGIKNPISGGTGMKISCSVVSSPSVFRKRAKNRNVFTVTSHAHRRFPAIDVQESSALQRAPFCVRVLLSNFTVLAVASNMGDI